MHASGLFGRELPGERWLDFAEVTALLDCVRRLDRYPEIHRSWYDVHAWNGD
jgi:hypothetical protein